MLVGSEKRKPLGLHSVYITSLCSHPKSGSDFCLEYTLGCELASLKGLSYEMDFENVDEKFTDFGLNKGRGWFLNFSEAPLIFG
jgi:hypothetical protein